MKLLFCISAILITFNGLAQSKMTPKEAFYYTLRANRQLATDKLSFEAGFNTRATSFQWSDFYASYLDKDNYIMSKNDEFKKVSYLNKYTKELEEGMAAVDFNKKFSFTVSVPFGTYDESCGCFPISSSDFIKRYSIPLLEIKEVGNLSNSFKNSLVQFRIGDYFNIYDIDFNLKLNPSDAEKLVDSKKDSYGNIKREVTMKITYNVTDKQFTPYNRIFYVGTYIHKIEFYNGSTLLSTVFPATDYYDKVNIIKTKPDPNPIVKVAPVYPQLTFADISGTYIGTSESAGIIITVNPDETFSIQTPENNIKGKATLTSTTQNLEEFINKIKTQLNKDVEGTGYILEFDFLYEGKNKHSGYNLFKSENNYFLCRDSKNIFKKKIGNQEIDNNVPVKIPPPQNKSNFIDHYDNEFSDGDYKIFDNNLYYKSNNLEIVAFSVNDIDRNIITDAKSKVGFPVFLKITIKGLTVKGGKTKFTLSKYEEDTNGTLVSTQTEKEEGGENPTISIAGGVRMFPNNNMTSMTVHLSFSIKDRNSDSIIHGFFDYTAVK